MSHPSSKLHKGVDPEVILAVTAVIYPIWRWVFLLINPAFIDPLWERLAISGLCGAGIVMIRTLGVTHRSSIFHVLSLVLYSHVVWTANQNHLAAPYLVGTLVTGLCISLAVLSQRWLWIMLGFSIVAGFIGPWEGMESDRILLIASLSTIAAACVVTTLARMRLFEHLATTLTELQQERGRLIHSARTRAAGHLASGISHEINNPLMIIVGRIHQLEQELKRDPVDRGKLEETGSRVLEAVDRISKIVASVKLFSRASDTEPTADADLNGVVRDVLVLSRSRFTNHDIELRSALDESGPVANMRRGQVGQALIAVLNNAHDAVQGRETRWVEIVTHVTPETVQIRVSDSGPGVPAHVKARLFEAFVSGDVSPMHTGLGLSTAQELMRENGGRIWLDTESPHTRFILELPRVAPL